MSTRLPRYLRELLQLVTKGYTTKAIAKEMGLSPSTVYTYVRRLKELVQDEPEMQSVSHSTRAALARFGQRYFEQNDRIPLSEGLLLDSLFRAHGLSLRSDQLSGEEYLHIDPRRRIEVFRQAVGIVESLTPSDEEQRRRVRQSSVSRAWEIELPKLVTYVEHDTDHAVMLILDWLKEQDPDRWQALHQNLDHLVTICYREARRSGLGISITRLMNTIFCYAHRFGPDNLAEKAMDYALILWERLPGKASAYIIRDMLQCDLFCLKPREEERFYDFLKAFATGTDRTANNSIAELIPGLEVLYFSPSVWAHQGHRLTGQLLPSQHELQPADWTQVFKQTLGHMRRLDLPGLALGNYALVLSRLIDANRSSPFRLFTQEIVDEMAKLSSLPGPNSFRGDPLLNDLWGKMVQLSEKTEKAWKISEEAFRAAVI